MQRTVEQIVRTEQGYPEKSFDLIGNGQVRRRTAKQIHRAWRHQSRKAGPYLDGASTPEDVLQIG